MKVKHVQQCRALSGWQPIIVHSHTDKDRRYIVHVNPWGKVSEFICECAGYVYRGTCRHQKEALEHICFWSESEGPEAQTHAQKTRMICPRCGGRTEIVMERDD